ncbi:rRNA accumulation-related protein [Exophiala xenobiotica]|nr:rRNA accumulation-related protein [Exophiala xenobiotica]
MATTNGTGPRAASQPDLSQLSSQIDLLVALNLWAWPALTLAIQNAWGGSAQVSNDKRDWMAGAVSELLTSTPPQVEDVADLEEVLLQVMVDEFEVVVDDDTAEEVARNIWSGAAKLRNGDLTELDQLYTNWQEKQKKGGDKVVGIVQGEDKDQDTDWDEDEDEEEEEWNGFADRQDVDMGEAPPLAGSSQPKQKIEPEVDEDGFTKVVSKKKR